MYDQAKLVTCQVEPTPLSALNKRKIFYLQKISAKCCYFFMYIFSLFHVCSRHEQLPALIDIPFVVGQHELSFLLSNV